VDAVAERLHEVGLSFRTIKGGHGTKKRSEAITAFQNDPPTRVFLLTAKSGAVGITLTAASHVYIMEPLHKPALELQAIGRSRRMGQTKSITVREASVYLQL
jgi:SWI/SNF-related matrix-associated actin-dependent regulator of chromatin subfamily A3